MKYRKCEICGFRSERQDGIKRYFMARYPLDEVRCKQWVKITGKEDLAYLPIEKLHQLKFVCGKHFNDNDFNKRRTQLKKTAIPSIRLTAKPLSDVVLIEFPFHVFKEQHATHKVSNKEIKLKRGYTEGNHIDQDHTYSKPDCPSTSTLTDVNLLDEGDGQDEPGDDTINIPDDDCQALLDDNCQVVSDDCQAIVDDDDLSFYLNLPKKYKESAEQQNLQEQDDELHEGFVCNNCSGVIKGYRYTCVQCSDYDLCGSCEARGAHCLHYVLRIPAPRPYAEIQSVLSEIRKQLRHGVDTLVQAETRDGTEQIIKEEVKEEGVTDPLSIDAPPAATTLADVTRHTDTVKNYNESTESATRDNDSASSVYTASTEEAPGGNTVLIIESRLEAADSTVVYNPRAKRKHEDAPALPLEVSPETAKKLKVVLTPLPTVLLRNPGTRLTVVGPTKESTAQYKSGVTYPGATFRVGRHQPPRTDHEAS